MNVIQSIIDSANSLFPTNSLYFQLSFYTVLIVIYSLFVFYSYKLFSKKNLFEFNFKQYLNTNHPTSSSILGFLVYLIEYLIILPFFVLLWFGFYSFFLLLLAKNLEIQTILLISTALIASIRITSFVSYNLSQDLASMLPFTVLALAITGEQFFSVSFFMERFAEVPLLFSSFAVYLVFIFIIEFILRFFDAIKIFVLRE